MRRRGLTTVRRAARLSRDDWHYLALAVMELTLARFRHATTPIAAILATLEQRDKARETVTHELGSEVCISRLSWAIGAAAARVPWRSDCLLQVMAADHWLRRHGLQPEFFLGVAKDRSGRFEAHAWLRCGGISVTGGSGAEFAMLIRPHHRKPRTSS